MISLNVLQYLNTANIYHNYEHLPYNLHKHKAKDQAQMITTPKRERPPKIPNANRWPLENKKAQNNQPFTNENANININN